MTFQDEVTGFLLWMKNGYMNQKEVKIKIEKEDLFNDFKAGIEHYLDFCQRKGIKPKKSYNGVLNIRIPSETHSRIATYAENHGTRINSFIRDSIERRLESI